MPTIRIATWNVLYRDRDARLPLVAETLQAVDPDIVLLQETDQEHATALANALGRGHRVCAVAPPEGSPIENLPAVMSRLETTGSRIITLPTDRAKNYFAVAVEFVTASGPLLAVSAHLRHTSQAGRMGLEPALQTWGEHELPNPDDDASGLVGSIKLRLRQLDTIRAELTDWLDRPLVLGGDLNFVPHGPEYREVLRWGLTDAWHAGPRLGSGATILEHNPLIADGPGIYADHAATRTPGNTGPLDYTLDYQFTSPAVRPRTAWIFGHPTPGRPWPSDHLGLAVDHDLGMDLRRRPESVTKTSGNRPRSFTQPA